MRLTGLINLSRIIDEGMGGRGVGLHRSTTDRTNLTTTVETTADDTAIDLHVGDVHITVGDVTATEHVTTLIQQVVAFLGIVELLHVLAIFVAEADTAVVDGHISRTEDTTTFTTAVDITVNRRDTVIDTGAAELTNYDMTSTENIRRRVVTDLTAMITHAASPATTIDITHHTTLDIGVGSGGETSRITVTLRTDTKEIVYTTGSSRSIDILVDRATEQGDISRAIHITAQRNRGTAVATTIGIVHHSGALLDYHVGVILVGLLKSCSVVHLCLSHQRGMVEVGVLIGIVFGVFTLRSIVVAKRPGTPPGFFPGVLILILQTCLTAHFAVLPSLRLAPVGIIPRNLSRRLLLIELHVLHGTLTTEHMTHLTTTIGLIDLGTVFQVHLGIFRPGIHALAGAIDLGQITGTLVRPDG